MLNRSTIITLLLITGVLLAVGFVTFKQWNAGNALFGEGADISKIQKGDSLPYTDLDGTPFDLSVFKGKVLVINAWASWCPFCVHELPDLGKLKSEFGGSIEVIAINRMESLPTVRAFIDHVGNPDGVVFLLDESDRFYNSIGGFAMPETMFYDPDGNIVSHVRGSLSLEDMRVRVKEALTSEEK